MEGDGDGGGDGVDTMGTTRRGRERAVQSRAGKKNHQLGELAGRNVSGARVGGARMVPLNRPSALALSLDYACTHYRYVHTLVVVWYLLTRWRDSMGWMYSLCVNRGG